MGILTIIVLIYSSLQFQACIMLKQSIDCQISSGCNVLHSKLVLDLFTKKFLRKHKSTGIFFLVTHCQQLCTANPWKD